MKNRRVNKFIVLTAVSFLCGCASYTTWTTKGFEDFNKGSFGNGGQNLYVSKAGVLQRIYQYDLDKNGFFDLVFCNAQEDHESANSFIYSDVMNDSLRKKIELTGHGTVNGLVADLNNDGSDEIIMTMKYDAATYDLNSSLYYGSKDEEYSTRWMNYLATPMAESVAHGYFSGEKVPSLVFVSRRKIRVFKQGEHGFEMRKFTEIPIEARQVVSGDFDKDGFDDVALLNSNGELRVYCGSKNGIDWENSFECPEKVLPFNLWSRELNKESKFTRLNEPMPLLQSIELNGKKCISLISRKDVKFFSMEKKGEFINELTLQVADAHSVAIGDLNGDQIADIVVAARTFVRDGEETSQIFWGSNKGFSNQTTTILPTYRAVDCVISDLDNDGKNELVICQAHTPYMYSTESLIFSNLSSDMKTAEVAKKLPTDDARRVFAVNRGNGKKELLFLNNRSRTLIGCLYASIYHADKNGFDRNRMTKLDAHGPVDSLAADLNDDGEVDLVLANCSEDSIWLDPGSYLHYSPFTSNHKMEKLPTKTSHGVVSGDFNKDGYLDLAFSDALNPYLRIFMGGENGYSKYEVPLIYKGKKITTTPRWITIGDLNGDGYLDLVVPLILEDSSYILWGGKEKFSFDNAQELPVYRGVCARIADLDKDGLPDLVFGGFYRMPNAGITPSPEPHNSFVHIFWNSKNGFSGERKTLLRCDCADGLTIADMNGDGYLDIFAGSYQNGKERDIDSFIYYNRNGKFDYYDVTRLPTHSASGGLAADFNQDGKIDLAVANHKRFGDHVGESEIWWDIANWSMDNVTALPTNGPHGITSVDVGNQLDRLDVEFYTSKPYLLKSGAKGFSFEVKGEVAKKTWVKLQLRSAETAETLGNAPWSEFIQVGESINFDIAENSYVQYRLEIGAEGCLNTPRITEINVIFKNKKRIINNEKVM